jgi:hypothetical protein
MPATRIFRLRDRFRKEEGTLVLKQLGGLVTFGEAANGGPKIAECRLRNSECKCNQEPAKSIEHSA